MACHCPTACKVCHCQKPPRPGTAVTALVKRYRENLDHYQDQHGSDKITQSLIDCCSALINEGARHDA